MKIYENKKSEVICEGYREQLAVELKLLSPNNNYLIKDRFKKLLVHNNKTLFGDYIEKWSELIKNNIESSTKYTQCVVANN